VGRVPQVLKELIVGRYIDSLPTSSPRTLVLRRSGLALWDPAEVGAGAVWAAVHVLKYSSLVCASAIGPASTPPTVLVGKC
jgi:hypothetical protein